MEKIHTGRFVTVNSSGQVELRLINVGIICKFGFNATYAVISGNTIQVNTKDGKLEYYKLSHDGYSVTGPYLGV